MWVRASSNQGGDFFQAHGACELAYLALLVLAQAHDEGTCRPVEPLQALVTEREALPLRADKILERVRRGKLHSARAGRVSAVGKAPYGYRYVSKAEGGGPTGSLVLTDGGRLVVGDEPLTIGRLPECDIVVGDPNVSRRHAEVRRQDGQFVVVDLDSTNGTTVNGARVKERRLADGDEIAVGGTRLRFEAS